MKLKLGYVTISDIRFGDKTCISGDVLYVNKNELEKLLTEDDRITSLELDIARPGEEVRMIPVKDVIEPRVKLDGKNGVFPGFMSKVNTVGYGETLALKGAAVVTCGSVVGFQEGIIDMSGQGAEYTPYSKTNNLVLNVVVKQDIERHEKEECIRMAGLKTAKYIGETAENVKPDYTEDYETPAFVSGCNMYKGLPRVAYVYQLQSQGLMHDTYVYGVDAKKILPTFIYPTEIMDGAVVSGNCVSACDKNTTYAHMNNPIIKELYARHGKELNFVGVILTNENVTLADKERSSEYTSKLVEMMNLDGVIISEEGFGNPDTDLIMNCKKLEGKGIKTVLVTDEYAGRDGASQSLADADSLADAVVTCGNANEVITLPPMKKVIGNPKAADTIAGGFDGSLREDGSIEAELQVITGSTSEIGFTNLSVAGY